MSFNLQNQKGGSINLLVGNTDTSTKSLTLPQENGTLLTSSNIPAATSTTFGGVKLTIVGNVLNITTV